jgi:aspartate/methionine/tyrosine aminotransferase
VSQRLYADPAFDVAVALQGALTPRTRAVYFVSPNNPDGKVLSNGQLMQIAHVAREHDLWVFADEVYRDIAFDAPHASFLACDPKLERTVLLQSFSKSHALAGARVGYAIARSELVTAMVRVSTHAGFNVPVAMQRVALAALREGRSWKAMARDTYRAARDACVAELRAAPIDFHVPEGATYVFLDLSLSLRGAPIRGCLERAVAAGVLVTPGAAFGPSYASFVRLCFTSVPEQEMVEGVRAFIRSIV